MITWEYISFDQSNYSLSINNGTKRPKSLQELGLDGWESYSYANGIYYLKRPIPERRYRLVGYDWEKYNFTQLLEKLYGVTDLSMLHKKGTIKYEQLFKVGADSSTIYHKSFYDKYREGWAEMVSLYESFIKDVVSNFYSEDILFQKFPTFRVHLPNNVAVGAFHTDSEFGHPHGEVNYIIPCTNSESTSTVYVESAPSKNDFEPIVLNVGQLVEFNGNILRHGNKINISNKTRVSMDFRILPLSKYDEHNQGESLTLKTKFKEDEYYKKLNK